eukprot:CFRG0934T1
MVVVIESRGDRSWVYKNGDPVEISQSSDNQKTQRVQKEQASTLLDMLKSAFLPIGYPDSVSEDYLKYQLWDTAQAFCSSINNILSHHALLQGYGVGDSTATASAAMITWMMRDGLAMSGRILFAWGYASTLDSDSKFWRLFADVLNDFAICVEIAAPAFSAAAIVKTADDFDGEKLDMKVGIVGVWAIDGFVVMACMGSLMKAIVSVAGGATRAALTQHQALSNNSADVAAKDGSQEQMVQLVALLFGIILTRYTDTHPYIIWPTFALLTLIHLLCNYKAVTCLVYKSINGERGKIIMETYLRSGSVITPQQMTEIEPLIPTGSSLDGFSLILGCSIDRLLSCTSNREAGKNSEGSFDSLLGCLDQYGYSVGLTYNGRQNGEVVVTVHKKASPETLIRAFMHAYFLARCFSRARPDDDDKNDVIQKYLNIMGYSSMSIVPINAATVNASYAVIDILWEDISKKMKSLGWNLNYTHVPVNEWRVLLKKTE